MNKIMKFAVLALLAGACRVTVPNKEVSNIISVSWDTTEAVLPVKHKKINAVHETKYFFKSDRELFDSTKAYLERNSDDIWKAVSGIFPIDCVKPDLAIRGQNSINDEGASWINGKIVFVSGRQDTTHIISNEFKKYGIDYEFCINHDKYLMAHEFGHHLFISRAEVTGMRKYWGQTKFNEFSLEQRLAFDLISEGMAEYFAYNLPSETLSKNSEDEQKKPYKIDLNEYEHVVDITEKVIYRRDAGYALVKPIVDAYGLKGIDYLATHPLKMDELHSIADYQKRCLNNLSRE